jgi:3-deoxy-D-manno-octulosonic-acid transferase
MLILLYSTVLTLVIAVMALRASVSFLRHPQYREGLDERFGRVRRDLAAAVAGKRVVWVHAVSVGEVLAASRLVKELGEMLGEGWEIVVSTVTHTGQTLARQRFGAERVFFTPIDFGFSVRAYLRALQPAAIVLIESGVWPRMMHECEKRSIPVVVVNARVGDRSFKRAMKMRGMWARVLRRATLWLAQSEEDARKLVEMGVPTEMVKVTGNLKYDVRAPKESRIAELIKAAAGGRPIVVAGSTVGGTNDRDPNEEEWLITIWGGRARNEADAVLVLAPRHPERFEQVWNDAQSEFPTVRATELLAGVEGTQFSFQKRKNGDRRAEIIILDTIGDLAAVYGVADIAFVGGSLIKRGGHNPLEPAQFGVPVVIGPSYENFRDVVVKMVAASGISITDGEAQLPDEHAERNKLFRDSIYVMRDSLELEVMKLLKDSEAARAMGERGRRVFEEQQGATKRAVDAIVGLVKP